MAGGGTPPVAPPNPWPQGPPLPPSAGPASPAPWPGAVPPGWPAPGVPGQSTRAALQTIRESVNLYWLSLLLSLISSLIASTVLGEWYGGGLGALTSLSSSGTHPLVGGGGAAGLAVLVLVLTLVVLILIIIAWLRWRRGGDQLVAASAEFGPQAMETARHSRSDVSMASYMFVIVIVVAIAIVVAAAGIVLANLTPAAFNPNGTVTSRAIPTSAVNEILAVVAIGVVIETVLLFLLYGFATRAIVDALAPYAATPARAQADAGRRFVMIGVTLSFVGFASAYVPYVSILSIVVALLNVYGYSELRSAIDAVLSQPVRFDPQAKRVDRFLGFI